MLFVALLGCGSPSSNNNPHVDGGPGGGGDGPPGSGDGPNPTTDGATSNAAVQIIVEPNGKKAAELVTAITAAQHSVYMTMYEIDDKPILDALVARAQAGVDVQAVLDASSTNKTSNTPAYNELLSAGAKPVWSNTTTFTFTHEKTVIIDGTVAWIMSMNANTSSPVDNREYLAIDTNAADVAEATAIFKADHANQSITPSGSLVVADTNARADLVALINSATKTLDVEGEEFSDTNQNGVVLAVAAAAHRGVTVHVVVSNGNADANSDATVKAAGGHVVVTGPTSDSGTPSNPYIHAKAMVVDCVAGVCAKGFIGSENFTAGSLGYNRELGVIFDDPTEIAKVKTAIDSDFAAGTAQ